MSGGLKMRAATGSVEFQRTVCVMLQAVFVVSVNLQGLFIFCFHCLRNTTVRSEWKKACSRIVTITTRTTTTGTTSLPLTAS